MCNVMNCVIHTNRNFERDVIGYNSSNALMERLLLNDDLTETISNLKGGLLLHQIGTYIQAKHCLESKFNGEEVERSIEVFELVGAKL